MAQITRNDYGSIVVSDHALEKLILEEILNMNEMVLLCNKKGKIIRDKFNPLFEHDYYDAISITDTIKENSVKIYLVTTFGKSVSNITDVIFKRIADIYDSLQVVKPDKVTIYVKGMRTTSGVIVKRDIEVEHSYA